MYRFINEDKILSSAEQSRVERMGLACTQTILRLSRLCEAWVFGCAFNLHRSNLAHVRSLERLLRTLNPFKSKQPMSRKDVWGVNSLHPSLFPFHSPAFTLAEVLITLGIIGVVAALTIPTLMNNLQDSASKSAWKRIYSELTQANQQIILNNNGQDFSGQCADWDDTCLRDLFSTKIKTIKICNNALTDGCIVADSKFMDGNTNSPLTINTGWPGFITQNGYSIKFRYHTKSCDYSYPRECGWMQVDVNGLEKPNIAGKDIFFINIAKNKLLPWGPPADCIVSGVGCSAKYLLE